MKKNIEKLKKDIIDELENSKAKEIISIDISKVSTLADYIIIATGTSSRHLNAIASKLRAFLKERGTIINPEGVSEGGWVVLDVGSIIVHLFTQEVREVYNLEKLWKFRK